MPDCLCVFEAQGSGRNWRWMHYACARQLGYDLLPDQSSYDHDLKLIGRPVHWDHMQGLDMQGRHCHVCSDPLFWEPRPLPDMAGASRALRIKSGWLVPLDPVWRSAQVL